VTVETGSLRKINGACSSVHLDNVSSNLQRHMDHKSAHVPAMVPDISRCMHTSIKSYQDDAASANAALSAVLVTLSPS
jgi:hypothetical protein